MENTPLTPPETLVSDNDQPRQQEETNVVNGSSITPNNIMTNKNLSKEYKGLLKILDKKNGVEGKEF